MTIATITVSNSAGTNYQLTSDKQAQAFCDMMKNCYPTHKIDPTNNGRNIVTVWYEKPLDYNE